MMIHLYSWIFREQNIIIGLKLYNCKCTIKTKTGRQRRVKNEEYIQNGYTPPPPGQKRTSGNEFFFIFNEVNFLINFLTKLHCNI